jgi:outer membrane murein-binding lipoprotein Lpp
MRGHVISALVAAALVLTGCNNSKSPDEVSKDVTTAEQKADNEVAKSQQDAQKALDKSYEKVAEDELHFSNDAVHQAYNVAVAKADGERKVALASCESQSGEAQRACKERAEADYKTSRAEAKASAKADVQHP